MNGNTLRPWIGLDSYDEKNSEIFYGRADEIKEILTSINYNSQIVIYGPSGIGKSSIVKAGIFPKLRKNYFLPIYIRLDHNDKSNYTQQIIETAKVELENCSADFEKVLNITDNQEKSLWEFFQSNNFWSKDNFPLTPVIVIDQFEEIFTLARNKKSVDSLFEQLFDLVNNYIPKYVRTYISENNTSIKFPDEINYKLIIIIREDFLGKLEDYDAKYPSLRKNRYSLQAINEEQAKEIIINPGGDLVNIEVAKSIIKKITNEAEFEFDDIPEITVEPALLSLFCTQLNEKRISEQKNKISLKLIRDFGDDIIKEFYEREITKVNEKTIEFLENRLLTSSGYRDSVGIDTALEYGISMHELEILVKNRIIRIFEQHNLQRIEYTHDILCKVAKENKDKRKVDQERTRNKKKERIKTATISLLLLFFLFSLIFINVRYFKEYTKYSSILIKQNGFLEGVDNLTKEQASHKSFYYKLSRNGKKGPYTLVEAFDGYGNYTTDHGISTILLNQWDEDDVGAKREAKERIKKMCKWRFVKGKDNEIIREDAFDKNDSLIWSFIYTKKIDAGDKDFIYGRFINDKQLPFVQREEGISIIRITYDDVGNEVLYEYYNNEGNPAKNSWNAYAEASEYDNNGWVIKQASLDEFGKYMTDRAGNTGQKFEYNNKGQLVKTISFGEKEEIKNVENGYAITKYEYDEYGNISKVLYFDKNEKPCKSDVIYGYEIIYNDKGKPIKQVFLDEDGVSPIEGYLIAEYKYDIRGNKIYQAYFDTLGHYANTKSGNTKKTWVYDEENLIDEKHYKYDYESDSLKLTYHYKVWLNDKKQAELEFLHDITCTYANYFKKSIFNEQGEKILFATYEFPGKYSGLNLKDENFLENYEESLLPIDSITEDSYRYHKWIDSIVYEDTIKVIRTYFDSNDTVLQYKETMKYKGKDIEIKYLDEHKNFLSATSYSHNFIGNISAISYIGISGNPYRNPYYIYSAYKLKYSRDINGKRLSYAAYNEYGEKSYARYYSEVYDRIYVFHKYDLSKNTYYDIDGTPIEDMDAFVGALNYLYFSCILPETPKEAKDKLRDGDIIVEYGNWKYDGTNIEDLENEYVRLKDNPKKITFLRLPEEKLIEINAPGNDYNLFFDNFYFTQKEHARIMDILGIINE